MAPRLKVFVTSDGLTDYVVAASSRAKALAAWGVRQDVFKEGAAHETDDPALVKAATSQPGEVLRKPAGTRDQLAKAPARAAKPRGPSKAQLKKIADLETRLADLDASHERAIGAIEAERAAFERKRRTLEERHAAQRQKLEAALRMARTALR
ncbi:hypothetical protein [Phenylobacterium sp.]|uniref:hypothetical protein n=1 Tax=Phenylobacterium sp. TaxID=1871053 RepID=UPI002E326FA4|nr:hypothetical protein [Phenylobacterium sp.]HEX4711809.1 hypothetical protein [Phenylobacterium sp.]